MQEKILKVMRHQWQQQYVLFGGVYPFSMATSNIKAALEREFASEHWTCADIRKILAKLAEDGVVVKDKHESRRGQAVWRLIAMYGE